MSQTYEEVQREAQRSPVGEAPLGRRLAAEFLGTLVFVALGTGAATALTLGPLRRLQDLSDSIEGFAQDPNAALLWGPVFGTGGPTLSELLPVALTFAFALAFLIYALGGTSGAHFNPAVTVGLAVLRRFRWGDVLPYIVVQVLGGIAGAFLVAAIYRQAFEPFGDVNFLWGATTVAPDVGFASALLAEALIGFILMTAIMAVAVDHRAPKGWSGLVIGIALGAGILLTGAATGGSANFARSFGPFVASMVFDAGSVPWGDLLVYALGPLIGAAAAGLVYESVTGLEPVAPAPEPGAATTPYDADAEVTARDGITVDTTPRADDPPTV